MKVSVANQETLEAVNTAVSSIETIVNGLPNSIIKSIQKVSISSGKQPSLGTGTYKTVETISLPSTVNCEKTLLVLGDSFTLSELCRGAVYKTGGYVTDAGYDYRVYSRISVTSDGSAVEYAAYRGNQSDPTITYGGFTVNVIELS